MKTVFVKRTREELIIRIDKLNAKDKAQWGRMTIYQMLKHCTIWEEWILGKNNPTYKQVFIGRVFGKIAMNNLLKDERPMKRNMPAGAGFTVKEKFGDIEAEKTKWIGLIGEYEHYANPDFIHDFFGRMTKEQVGLLAFKHTDHHLRQFNK